MEVDPEKLLALEAEDQPERQPRRRVLLTSFGAFGDVTDNPSTTLCRELFGNRFDMFRETLQRDGHCRLERKELEVTVGAVNEFADAEL